MPVLKRLKVGEWSSNRFRVELGKRHQARAVPANRLREKTYKQFKEANANQYTFRHADKFRYFDDYVSSRPHLIILDHSQRPLFVLGYVPASKYSQDMQHIEIQSIQRYTPRTNWVAHTSESKERTDAFRQRTGMNADDFLLSEFIHMNRGQLNNGTKMYLLDDEEEHQTVARLRDRFCKKKPVELRKLDAPGGKTKIINGYEIDTDKERVKWVLV